MNSIASLVEDLMRATPFYKQGQYILYQTLDIDQIRNEIDEKGYSIVKRLIQPKDIETIRSFWLNEFTKSTPSTEVIWGPTLGQRNAIGFTSNNFQTMYRSYSFLWNEPYHELTQHICLRLNIVRNFILELPALSGIAFSPDRYGLMVTTSYYPPTHGWMQMHNDGTHTGKPLVHHIVPLTFKGTHYREGGMEVVGRDGKTVDLDSLFAEGDVVFYDASLNHGVKKIIPNSTGTPIGRMQMFAIPRTLANFEDNMEHIRRIPMGKIVRSRYMVAKNILAGLIGKAPVYRA